jgi:oxygen-independent coproporphyrinogen-3 oxidase
LAGIYLHIPFCRQACTYCNFHFSTSLHYKPDLIGALLREMELEKDYLDGAPVHTVYFGGGTPSLLDGEDCRLLLEGLRRHFPVAPDAEVTLEANPDDIDEEKLRTWKSLGINRLSIGVQSFQEEELRWMNRAHNSRQALESLHLAVKEFNNITMDLIYGSPFLSDEQWKEHVDLVTDMGISHLSCYALTVEEKTPLHKSIRNQRSLDVDPDKQARQFLMLMQWMREKGYEHYEVSNFAKPGYRSRHNSSYWKGVSYLGLGPSAHAYNGKERRWNVANNTLYIAGMNKAIPNRESEVLSPTDVLNETVMISLRTREGLSLQNVEERWGKEERERIKREASKFLSAGLLVQDGHSLRLTDEGMLRADGIAAELFQEKAASY